MDNIVILGYGGHARSIADSILKAGKFNIVGYTDQIERESQFRYLGTDEKLGDLYKDGVRNAVLGVGFMGNSYVRDSLVKLARSIGYKFPVIVDSSAKIALDGELGEGTFVGKNAVVNAGAKIGSFCIINTGAIVEHENIIGDYSHIAVGAVLCGAVKVGKHTLIGANTTVIQGKVIGDECVIGANSTILSDVEDAMKNYGIVSNR